jgi:PAS domain S-box-containing protein
MSISSALKAHWPTGRTLSLGVAIILMVGANAVSYVSQQELMEAARAVDHSHQVLYQTEKLLSNVKDIGNGLRLHLATGDRRHLERSDEAISSLPNDLTDLGSLVADNPLHRQRLDSLRPLIDERLAWLNRLIETGRSQGVAALTDAETQVGRDQMERIRELVGAMTAEETDLNRIRVQTAQYRARVLGLVQIGVTAVSLAVITVLFLQMFRDVQRRRVAETALKDLNTTLENRVSERTKQAEDSELRYRNVVDLIQEAIWIHVDGKVIFANPSAARLFAAGTPEGLIGRDAVSLVHPEDRNRAAERTRDLRAGPHSVPVIEMKLQAVDGTTRTAEIHAVSFREAGKVHVMASARDVTALREAESQLRQAQKMESVGQLTGGVAHDFNNLLTVIIGNLDVAVDRVSADLRSLIESSLRAAERGSAMIKQMLAFSRRQVLTPDTVNLNEMTSGMHDLLSRTLGEHIEIEMKLAPNLWLAFADRGQVESALLNLAVNARDAMAEGGKLTIETGNVHLDEDYAARNAEVTPGDYAMLAVTDTGCGMALDVVERAFEPFFTTKRIGSGSGLGLSMIYGFAKQSGGHLKIYSEVGHGTTVRLYLPRGSAPTETIAAPLPIPVSQTRGGETILVVEDDADVRAYVVGQLKGMGYDIIEAADGPQAEKVLQSETPIDLLFTDVVMPGGMTGRKLAEQAKAHRPRLKTLFTSGYTENSIIHQGKLDPGVHLLSKPYRRQELARKIREVLDELG